MSVSGADMVARLEQEGSAMKLAITVAECRQTLSLGPTKIYELINSGELESFKVGRRRLIKWTSVQAMLDGSNRSD